ncbi:serine/threonine-protein kinase [Amycolatopsis albispora]|uniref:non-specific serine/threonine protein kinase n=1 Tax=Amycolatopsis albispora TaxID=1804986 RepID=A0A344L509_9PSEU|nr:serine/threonine-protein kinase [Amycolatopsis albispora]AXB43133.1 hypothetical protein A4R43_11705 [Amycolatopsis albispora]
MQQGQLISGRYRLEEKVGTGGMGVVWRAVDEQTGEPVALKLGSGDLCREAEIAAKIRHPGVVRLHELTPDGADQWLVMEYVPARSLATRLSEGGTLSPAEAARIGAQLAGALAAVHAAGIVHRDVTPANALITEDGTAKLTDFGISRPVWREVTMTEGSLVPGTPGYLAPEVAGGADPTTASDVFSLGAVLFRAVEGTSPFGEAENPLVLLRRAVAADIRPAPHAEALGPVLSALLSEDPADRPDAARARELLEVVASGATTAEVTRALDRRPGKGKRVVLALAAAVVVAAAATVVVLANRDEEARPVLMGDPHTADPCGLTDAAALARFGTVTLETDYGAFERCDVMVQIPDGIRVDVRFELGAPLPPGTPDSGPADELGGMRVLRRPLEEEACLREIVLADRNRVYIEAERDEGEGTADYCAISDLATEIAVGKLAGGEVPRRPRRFDADSLAQLKACELLDAAALARIPGAEPAHAETEFADWACDWENPAAELGIQLKFDRNQPLSDRHGTAAEVNGHEVRLDPEDDGAGTCVARVVHRGYHDRDGRSLVELVHLTLDGDLPVDRICETTSALATAVAGKLPG